MTTKRDSISAALGKRYIEQTSKASEQSFAKLLNPYGQEAKQIHSIADTLFTKVETMSTGGKKLRSALITLGYELAGKKYQGNIHHLGLLIELFHTALLIHDDIMDRDEKRRGEISLHTQFQQVGKKQHHPDPNHFGISMGINAGDLAFYLSWKMLSDSGFPAEQQTILGNLYSRYALRLIYGQAMDITNLPLSTINNEAILNIMRYKTAEYTGVLPLIIGAIVGGADEKELEKLKKYGLALGWAFQIQDDLLGLFGDTKQTGKPVGADIREGKKTLLMLELFNQKDATIKKRQKELLGEKNITEKEIDEMKNLLITTGVYEKVKQQGWDYVNEAITIAETLNTGNRYKNILTSLAVYIMERVS